MVKLETKTREALVFDVGGVVSNVAEPVFVPPSDDAPEGDGYVIACAYRPGAVNGELVILDSNDFSKPLDLVKLPFQMRDQVHGNWIPNPNPGKPLPFLSGPPMDISPSDVGPLNRFGLRKCKRSLSQVGYELITCALSCNQLPQDRVKHGFGAFSPSQDPAEVRYIYRLGTSVTHF